MGIIQRQGVKNMVILYSGILIGAIGTLFIQPHCLLLSELGLTRTLYNVSFLLSIALPFGLPNIIIKTYQQYKLKNDTIAQYFFQFILFYFLLSSIFISFFHFLTKPYIGNLYNQKSQLFYQYISYVLPQAIFIAFNSVICAYSQALKKSTVPSFLNDFIARIIAILITVMYFNQWISFNTYLVLYISIFLFTAIALLLYLSHFNLIQFNFKNTYRFFLSINWKENFKIGLNYCIISFTSFGIRSIDIIIISFSSLQNVAIYTTALFLSMFIEVPLNAIERSSLAKITEHFENKQINKVYEIYESSVKHLVVLGGIVFIGLNINADLIISFLPRDYFGLKVFIFILGIASFINVSTGINNTLIFYTNLYKSGLILLISIFTLGVFTYSIIIPKYGLLGAACVTASLSILYNLSKYLLLLKVFKFQPFTKSFFFLLLISLGISSIVFYVPAIFQNIYLNAIINNIVFIGIYIWFAYKFQIIPNVFLSLKK